jgi:hypothetical protein
MPTERCERVNADESRPWSTVALPSSGVRSVKRRSAKLDAARIVLETMLRFLRGLSRGLCLLVVLWTVSTTASGAQGGPVALHLTFRKIASHASWVQGNGRYIGYTTCGYRCAGPWRFVLLDDLTGNRRAIKPCPAGRPVPSFRMASHWVAFDCGPAAKRWQLYNVQTRRWRRLACAADCRNELDYADLSAIGAVWMLVEVTPPQTCGPDDPEHNECGPTTYLFYNIRTGRVRTGLPTLGPNEFVDLNSARLTSRMCYPVSAPTGSVYPPPVARDGRFVFVQASSGIYVQRCGSSEQTYLTTDPNKWSIRPFTASFYENDQAAGFCTSQSTGNSLVGTLEGIYLPTLTRFTAAIPPGGWCGVATLGPRHIYIEGPEDTTSVLAAAFPPRPPPL